jgi:hypothetical protein
VSDEETVLTADGFDDALLGIGYQFTLALVVYDRAKCIAILMERDGMSRDDAVEFFEVNVQGSYVGEQTPVFLTLEEPE